MKLEKIAKNKKGVISVIFLVVSILVVSSGLIITVQNLKKSDNKNIAETEFDLLDSEFSNQNSLSDLSFLNDDEGWDFDSSQNSFLSGDGGGSGSKKESKECGKEIESYNQEILEKIVPDKSPEERLEEINKKIKEKGARWKAGLTPKALLSVEEKRKLLGNFALPDKDDSNIKEVLIETDGLSLPSYFDWRDKDGENWMTSVKDQGMCGSCWAFSAVGTVEAAFNIYNNNPNIDLDLSEQQLVSNDGVCCDRNSPPYCGDCSGGCPRCALQYIRDTGIADEACFPYTAATSPCNLCVDWEERKHHILNHFVVTPNTTETYKQTLMNYGPLLVAVYSGDIFYYYVEGIYEELEDINFTGLNHAIVLVGWNDAGGYWIIKNNWGDSWGESGYGKIVYGDIEKYNYVYAVELFIECYQNLDCGTDGYVGNPFCQNEDVWQDYRTYTCNNPGTTDSDCSYSIAPKLKESCGSDYCENWQDNYCKEGDVYHNRTCYDKVCVEGACYNEEYEEEKIVRDCHYGCENGICKEPKPDLVVEDLIVQAIKDKTVTLAFTIKNIGNVIADSVYWMVDTNSFDENPERIKPISLEPDNWTRAYMMWNYSQSGNYIPKVIVDFDNIIDESNEDNNEESILVGV